MGQWSIFRSMEPYFLGTDAAYPAPGTLVLLGLSLSPPSSNHCQYLSRWKFGCREGQGPMCTSHDVSLQGMVVFILPWAGSNTVLSTGDSVALIHSQFRNCVCPNAEVAVPWGGLPMGGLGSMPYCKGRCLAWLYPSWPRLSQSTSWWEGEPTCVVGCSGHGTGPLVPAKVWTGPVFLYSRECNIK